ncbi:unnamed protein product [Closterium sp. NIES-53]
MLSLHCAVMMLLSDRGGEFLGRAFTNLVEEKGILHNLICPYTPHQNGMAEREMHTVVEAMRTMLLHMGEKHQWWHLALRQAVWVRICLERASLPSGKMPQELLFKKKTSIDEDALYPVDRFLLGEPSTARADGKLDEEDADDFPRPSPSPPVVDLPMKGSPLAAGDEGRLGASPAALTGCITDGRRDAEEVSDGKRQTIGEPSATKLTLEKLSAEASLVEKLSAEAPTSEGPLAEKPIPEEQSVEELPTGEQFDDDSSSNVVEVISAASGDEGELSIGEHSDNNAMMEIPVEEEKPRQSTHSNIGNPHEKLSYHACLPPTAYSTLLNDAEADVDLPEFDPNMHADPEHH